MNHCSKTAAVARGLLALALLFVLLAAVPYLLLHVGVLPHHMPSWEEASSALTSPDDGQLFLGALTLIGWYGWGTFVISVALEAVSALRDRNAPRIKLLGGSQQLAGALIGGILLLLPTGTAFATPAPTTATPISAPSQPVSNAASAVSTLASAAAAKQYAGPVHHVQAGDSLWEIAEKRLGSGPRWHEIVEANRGVPQADGTHLTEDTTILQPGWTLRLPGDVSAKPSAAHGEGGPGAQSDRTTAQDITHTVLPGETLSSIAEDRLGDATDYPKIAALNDAVRQPDGRTLTDPDEIHPGWQLKIPAVHADNGKSDHASATPTPDEQPSSAKDRDGDEHKNGASQQDQRLEQGNQQDRKEQGAGPAGGKETAAPHDSAAPTRQPQTPAPREPAEQPTADRPAADASADAAPPPASNGSDQSVRTVAAAGSILAAAVLAVVA
ncbi:LysM peptidoglycan-binding domain-containing protein, partial [Streptomyces chryseus]